MPLRQWSKWRQNTRLMVGWAISKQHCYRLKVTTLEFCKRRFRPEKTRMMGIKEWSINSIIKFSRLTFDSISECDRQKDGQSYYNNIAFCVYWNIKIVVADTFFSETRYSMQSVSSVRRSSASCPLRTHCVHGSASDCRLPLCRPADIARQWRI